MAAFFATRTRAEVSSEGRRRGINACVVNEPGDVLGDPHLAARGFFEAEAGLRRPSRFALLRPGPAETTRSGPVPRHSGARPGPLAGVRVLDFSWALVGSITTKTLGDLGADVIKVESRTRPCLSRLDVQVAASRAGHLDDKPWFAHLNTSKRSLALDLRQPAARTVLDPLLDWADVVVENFSPGTMARLGLDYDRLAARNPALVMVSGSVFGQSGPLAHEWGVDGTGAALSGRTYLTGWPDRDPVIPGAVPYGDVIVPYVMAATVAAALQYRAHSGRGLHIDCSMYEICVQQMTAAILAAQTGPPPRRTGNTEPDRLLQDVFPAQGEDRWVAITVTDQAQLDRLHALAGGSDISRWTRQRPDHALMAELQAAGIAAGVVQDIEDLLDRDPQLATRGALVELDHPLLGPFGHLRTALHFSRDRFAVFRAPGIGEHSLEVAREVASLAAAELDQLMQAGVFE
ncbi:MAG: CoA transferase [Gammaproteobacteria bacterium]|nr:CoA transferase [Gammaproteobacteria bacterium]